MTDLAVVMKALDWMKANDELAYDEALEAFESGDVETLEELVAGVPDSESGRVPPGDDTLAD